MAKVVPQLPSPQGTPPIFLWLPELLDLSQGIQLALAGASQRSLPFRWEGFGITFGQEDQTWQQPGRACATLAGLGCSEPPPWVLLEMGDGK